MTTTPEEVAAILGLVGQGDSAGALRLADRLIAEKGADVQLLFVKSEALRQLGDLPAAEALLQQIHEDAPDSAEVLFRLGLTRLDRGNLSGALQAFDASVQRASDHAGGWLYLGRCLFLQGNFTDAEKALRRSLELDPASRVARILLSICLAREQIQDEEVTAVEESLLQQPEQEPLAGALLNTYIGHGLQEPATLLSQAMVDIFPDSIHWYTTLGMLMNVGGRYEEATNYSRSALAIDPKAPGPMQHLAQALRHLGQIEEAIRLMRGVIESDPQSVEANLGLAGMLIEAGRSVEAAEAVAAFDLASGYRPPVLRSVVIAVLDYSPGSPFNIKTLLEDLKDFDGEVICVFNGDEVYEQLRDHPRIDKYAYNKFNVGVSRGWNIGINQAEGETIHILNADLHISVGMLDRLENWVQTLPDALCVGVTAHWTDFATLKETKVLNAGQFTEPMEADAVSGQLFTFHAGRLHDAGISFDPRLAPYFGEETDLAYKVKKSGYKIYAVPENDFEHPWGISLRDRPVYCFGRRVNRISCMVRNRLLLRRKIDAWLAEGGG